MTLKKSREIRLVLKKGRSFVNRYFVLYVLPNEKPYNKVAFCTGRAAGKAVIRNRIRRRTKETFHQVRKGLPPGYSLVIIARPPVYGADFSLLGSAMQKLLGQAGLCGGKEQ